MNISRKNTILEQLHKKSPKARNMKTIFVALLMCSLGSHDNTILALNLKRSVTGEWIKTKS
jgi:hypothetical protein